ncbi:hypothetical protein WJX75_000024 [Coccomyxa subellipsoidea]|uniref:Uncharacterized protein n=1 Tax=Coccomyxa subellipsoidea TaxID=248742 RepID=A0ABR2Z1W7_9CHLO
MVTPQPQDEVVKKAIEQLNHVVDELTDTGSDLDVVVTEARAELEVLRVTTDVENARGALCRLVSDLLSAAEAASLHMDKLGRIVKALTNTFSMVALGHEAKISRLEKDKLDNRQLQLLGDATYEMARRCRNFVWPQKATKQHPATFYSMAQHPRDQLEEERWKKFMQLVTEGTGMGEDDLCDLDQYLRDGRLGTAHLTETEKGHAQTRSGRPQKLLWGGGPDVPSSSSKGPDKGGLGEGRQRPPRTAWSGKKNTSDSASSTMKSGPLGAKKELTTLEEPLLPGKEEERSAHKVGSSDYTPMMVAGGSDELASGVDRMLPSSTPSGNHTPSSDSYAPRSSTDMSKGEAFVGPHQRTSTPH